MESYFSSTGLRDQISHLIDAGLDSETGRCPTLNSLASRMSVSTRTLKRHLRGCGIGYRQLVAEARRRRVTRLLCESSMSLDAIARHAGYGSGNNLSRAFRRWTGVTPGEYRRRDRNAVHP